MKKNFTTMNGLRTLCAVLLVCFMTVSSYGQVAGDYGSRNATSTWATISDWLVFVSAADWSDATVATAVPSTTKNVYIRSGHNMTVGATGSSKNLTVDGTLTANASVRVYGPAMTVNGTVTGSTAGILEVATLLSTDSLTISGPGSFSIGRIRPLSTATVALNAVINMNVNLSATGAAGLGANVYANGFRVRIPSGKTVTTANTGYVSAGATGTNDPATPGTNFTIEVEGTLNVGTDATNAATTNLNLRNFISTKTTTLIVRSSGTVNIYGNLLAPTAGAGTSSLTVESGGTINFKGYNNTINGTCDLSKATTTIAGTIDFNASATGSRSLGTSNITGTLRMKDNVFPAGTLTLGSTAIAEYYGTTATLPATPTSYPNLTINNSGGAALSSSITVNGALNLAAGTLTLGANTLTANGTVTKTSGNIDASASPMNFGNTAPLTLPVGAYTGAVNSLTMNGAGGITLSELLTVTNALTLTSGNITLGANNLVLNGAVSGGSNSSHVVTNSSGVVKRLAITAGVFPVGPTAGAYNPITIANSVANDFAVNVAIDAAPTRINNPEVTLGRTWNITSLTASADVTLGYNDADALSISCVPTDPMRLSHFMTGTGTWEDKGNATPVAGVGTDRQVTYAGINSFSPFLLGNVTAVLAIDLQNFTAKTQGTTNVLNWSTTTERNNSSFNIQRSSNGTDFTTIGAVKGNGSKTTISEYSFTDNTPLNGINYYRLRAVENDGKATLSKSVAVVNGKSTTGIVKLYPSAADAVLTVETITEGATTLNIVDVTGRTVLTKTIKETGFSSTPIDVNGLSNGVYFMVFKSSTTQAVQKFIKN
jgi:hypothetical protein